MLRNNSTVTPNETHRNFDRLMWRLLAALAVLIACGLWLQNARATPVSCSPGYTDNTCLTPIHHDAVPAPTCPAGWTQSTAPRWIGSKWTSPGCQPPPPPPDPQPDPPPAPVAVNPTQSCLALADSQGYQIDTTQVVDGGYQGWYFPNGSGGQIKRTVHVLEYGATGPSFYDGCGTFNTYFVNCGLDPATNSALRTSPTPISPGRSACGGPN
jgi:hypothetical protein